MKKTVRVGLIGAGFIAGHHCAGLRRAYGVDAEVVGVTDVAPARARAFARARKIKAFPDLATLLPAVDVVVVCTPPAIHAENILAAAQAGKHILCEKPLVGYAPPPGQAKTFRGDLAPKAPMLKSVLATLRRIRAAVRAKGLVFAYFENFVHTPQLQKEREIIEKTGAQILRMIGEESHRGNLAAYSSHWKYACGGSLISTGSHPLGAILYLKRIEGLARGGRPIRPASVSARTHALTRIKGYRDKQFLRADYHDVEDYAWAHVVFEDGTVGDVIAGATVLGGINDYVEVFANNHRSRCNINPVGLLQTYNPGDEKFKDLYVNYGVSTHEGWLNVAPDENWMFGYQAEVQDALECIVTGREPAAGLELAVDTMATIYSAYLSAERSGAEVKIERIG